MTNTIHPAAPHHLPVFITAPDQSDVFLIGCAVFLVIAVLGLGTLYFRLHALPEHLAHGKANKLQFEVVAVLALLALFTHNTGFWVAALLLALVPVPDLYTPLSVMAESLAKMAGWRQRRVEAAPEVLPKEITWAMPSEPVAPAKSDTAGNRHALNDERYPADVASDQGLPKTPVSGRSHSAAGHGKDES